MSEAMTHLQELAGRIGARPAATDTEAEAADYIQGEFEARGLQVERQGFLTPRTYSWAYVIYHILTIGAVVLANWFPWPAFVLAMASAVLLFSDLETRWGLSALMPKGPSQNIVGHRPADVLRGETARKVVIVAHYDSARSSLAFHPALVKNFNISFGLMKWCTWLVPPLVLVAVLPFGWVDGLQPGLQYVTLALAAYLFFPLLINVHREFFMRPVAGANDNASGVAVMLDVLARAMPDKKEHVHRKHPTQPMQVVMHGEEAALEEDVVPEGAFLNYAPVDVPYPEVPSGEDMGTDLDGDLMPATEGQTSLDLKDEADASETPGEVSPHHGSDDEGLGEWLGLEGEFDVRNEGRRIGSWDRFDDKNEDEEGEDSKGGAPASDDLDSPGFAAMEASRIRSWITSGKDRGLAERELWFVATGAEEVGTWGMKEFLKKYGDELSDAAFINLDNLGSGNLCWVTREGMARRRHADRRLISAARRASRESDLRLKGREYRGLSTDATAALVRGYRAISIMAFDINGRLPNWHWRTDTVENVDPGNLERAAEFVTELAKQA